MLAVRFLMGLGEGGSALKLKDLKRANPFRTVDSGICGCGAEMEGHPIWDNHSPTDIPLIKRDLLTAWFCWFMGMEPEK